MRGEAVMGEHRVAFDFNALCLLEEEVGPIGAAMEKIGQGSFKTVRALVWAGLQKHHAGTSLSAAGDIVGAVGFDVAVEAIGVAMESAFPAPSAEGKAKAA